MFLVGDQSMSSLPEFPRAALAAGLPARFLYWFGRSGQRYLFSCTGFSGAADFESGVVIAVSGTEIVWSGEVAELLDLPKDAPARRAAIYIHLLASTLAARRAIADDLRPAVHAEFRLAA
jgi:hypothetical protein